MKDNFCIVPFTQLDIATTGKVRPCCEFDGWLGNINDSGFIETWNNDKFKELRQQFKNNIQPAGCKKCFTQESAGIKSKRQLTPVTPASSTPTLLDIKFNNKCNMKCRICDSNNSHLWEKEETLIFGRPNNRGLSGKWVEETAKWEELNQLIDSLETLYISGGEPLLLKELFVFLEHCVKKDKAKDISMRIITNGTIKISKNMHEVFKQFKNVRLVYSIDDIGPRFKYQRYPVEFSKVESNFKDAIQHDYLDIGINYTVSIHNCLSGSDMVAWLNQIGFEHDKVFVNYVRDPEIYDLSVLRQEQKDNILKFLSDNFIDQEIKKYLTTQFRDVDFVKMEDFRSQLIKRVDEYRNEKFKDTFPLVSEILSIG